MLENGNCKHSSEADNKNIFQWYCLIYQILQVFLSTKIIIFIIKWKERCVSNAAISTEVVSKCCLNKFKHGLKNVQNVSWYVLIFLPSAIQFFLLQLFPCHVENTSTQYSQMIFRPVFEAKRENSIL